MLKYFTDLRYCICVVYVLTLTQQHNLITMSKHTYVYANIVTLDVGGTIFKSDIFKSDISTLVKCELFRPDPTGHWIFRSDPTGHWILQQ